MKHRTDPIEAARDEAVKDIQARCAESIRRDQVKVIRMKTFRIKDLL